MPFFIEPKAICKNAAENDLITCDKSLKHHNRFNLIDWVDQVHLEKKVGDFRPDVHINNLKGQIIFFEIKVSHGLSAEKTNSKYRIIEIDLASMGITKFKSLLRNNSIGDHNEFVRFVNFKIKPSSLGCATVCPVKIYTFAIRHNDEVFCTTDFSLEDLLFIYNKPHPYFKHIGLIGPVSKIDKAMLNQIEDECMRAASNAGILRNCNTCEHFRLSKVHQGKKLCNKFPNKILFSTTANQCSSFTPMTLPKQREGGYIYQQLIKGIIGADLILYKEFNNEIRMAIGIIPEIFNNFLK